MVFLVGIVVTIVVTNINTIRLDAHIMSLLEIITVTRKVWGI